MQPDPETAKLSYLVNSSRHSDAIAPVLARVEIALADHPNQPQAWEPLALTDLPFKVPGDIQSCWVFILRAGATFGAERHPNSHQRTVALSGDALFEILIDDSWSQWPIRATSGEKDSASAVSIPPSVWHRITIGQLNFVSMSFHTVPVEQLIEEIPVEGDLSVTTQRLYYA
jgi:hypothetical protein